MFVFLRTRDLLLLNLSSCDSIDSEWVTRLVVRPEPSLHCIQTLVLSQIHQNPQFPPSQILISSASCINLPFDEMPSLQVRCLRFRKGDSSKLYSDVLSSSTIIKVYFFRSNNNTSFLPLKMNQSLLNQKNIEKARPSHGP